MLTVIVGVVSGLAGLVAGSTVSESIKAGIGYLLQRGERRSQRDEELRKVVMEVDPKWEGYTYEYRGDLDVAGMRVKVELTNHGSQLVKNVRVTMRRRPSGVDSARMLPALPPGKTEVISIERDLGLIDDQPFEEVEGDWLEHFWFEALYEDTGGRGWRLEYNPRDDNQTVDRRRY
jgi:hypothetical protein